MGRRSPHRRIRHRRHRLRRRLSTSGTRFARFDQLRVVQAYSWHDFEYPLPIIKIPVDGVLYPAWTDGKRSQRDYAAEAMNY